MVGAFNRVTLFILDFPRSDEEAISHRISVGSSMVISSLELADSASCGYPFPLVD